MSRVVLQIVRWASVPAREQLSSCGLLSVSSVAPRLLLQHHQPQSLHHHDARLPFACNGGARRGFIQQFYDHRKIMEPDVYDPQQAKVFNTVTSLQGVLLGEPYKPLTTVPSRNPWANDSAGWTHLDERLRLAWRKHFTVHWMCIRSVAGYSPQQLRSGALLTYREVNAAIASGKLASIRPLVLESLYDDLSASSRELRSAAKEVQWGFAAEPTLDAVTLVDAHVSDQFKLSNTPTFRSKLRFVQFVVRIQTKQTFAAYNKQKQLVAGDPEQVLDVVDYWVFERPIIRSWFIPKPGPKGAIWRVAARLNVLEPTAPAAAAAGTPPTAAPPAAQQDSGSA